MCFREFVIALEKTLWRLFSKKQRKEYLKNILSKKVVKNNELFKYNKNLLKKTWNNVCFDVLNSKLYPFDKSAEQF